MSVLAGNERDVQPDVFWIRRAGSDDLLAMTRLLQELFANTPGFELDVEKQRCGLQMLIDAPLASLWVAECRGRVAGMLTVQLVVSTAEGAWSGLAENLIVSPEYRRRGIGKGLVDAAVKWCREQGATRVQLLADGHNVPAIIFCRKQEWMQTNMIALRRML